MGASIPVVDLSDRSAGADFVDAYERLGFAQIVGHGVAADAVAAAFEAAERFHALPLAAKRTLAISEHHRGYIGLRTAVDVASAVDRVDEPNESESFMVLHEPDLADQQAGTFLAGPNQWPRELPGFREAVETYRAAMMTLGRRMIGLVATELRGARVLDDAFARPTTWLRLLHYPPRSPDASPGAFGSAPHRDFGALTLLAQDGAGGLEVRDADGGWIAVPPTDGAFVVNVGDMLHRWSNGRLRSTPHRVVNPVGRERFSIAYFFDPHVDTVIEPLPGSVGSDGPRFAPIVFGDEVRRQLVATYRRHQP